MQSSRLIEVGERQLVEVQGIGTVRGTTIIGNQKRPINRSAVLSVPTMMCMIERDIVLLAGYMEYGTQAISLRCIQ